MSRSGIPAVELAQVAIDCAFCCPACHISSILRIEDLAAWFAADTPIKALEPRRAASIAVILGGDRRERGAAEKSTYGYSDPPKGSSLSLVRCRGPRSRH